MAWGTGSEPSSIRSMARKRNVPYDSVSRATRVALSTGTHRPLLQVSVDVVREKVSFQLRGR